MIPSFLPVHQRRARGQVLPSSVQTDPDTGLNQLTLNQILVEAGNYRFVDGCHIDYASLLALERSNINLSPLSANGQAIAWPAGRGAPKVIVVGAGLGGLLTALQLKKTGMQVTLFEAGDTPANQNGAAGRIRAVEVRPGDSSTSAELGAMRFPTTSYLFWHYLACSGAAAPGTVFTAFPNVASVPSAFTGTGVSGVWSNGGLGLPPDYEALNTRHLAAFEGYAPPGGPAGATIASIAALLKKPPTASDITTINQFWDGCIATLYGTSYLDFLVSCGFTQDEIKRIGYMGIGTGGFEPLFGVDVLDIMRLFLWGYSNEMAVPGLKQLPQKLFDLVHAGSGAGSDYRARVLSVLFSPSRQRYSVVYVNNGGFVYAPEADFVVLAMTHVAAKRLLQSSPVFVPFNGFAPDAIVPFYDPRYGHYASHIKPELSSQLAMSAVKIFHTIAGPALSGDGSLKDWVRAIPARENPYDPSLRTCYGTFADSVDTAPIGVSYMLPRTNATLRSSTYVMGLHYAWGTDADKVNETILQTTPAAAWAINFGGVYRGRNTDPLQISGKVANALQQRFIAFMQDGKSLDGNLITGLAHYFMPYRLPQPYAEEGWFAAVYWNKVPYVWGGFKLDQPGVGGYLAYAYKLVTNAVVDANQSAWDRDASFTGEPLHVVHPAIKGLYFAGDSFSNYGGWAEGAFQSAIATAAGIVKSAAYQAFGDSYVNHVNMAAITALVDKARDPSSYAHS